MFLVGIITDLIWTPYIRKLADKEYFQASFWSVAVGICSIGFLQGFLVYKATAIFWLMGQFIGTWKAPLVIGWIDKIIASRK
jgi:flagellar biosynthesis protein FliR